MDNNFYKILEIFKGLNESIGRDDVVIDGKQVDLSSVQVDSNDHFRDPINAYISSAKFVDGTPLSDDQCRAVEDNYPGVVTDNLLDLQIDAADHYRDAVAHGDFDESSTGTKFVGYATAGMNAKQAKNHMVGADESVEMECDNQMSLTDKLRARWEKTKSEKGLQEYGMTTGGTANPAANGTTDPAAVAKTAQNAQKNLGALKQGGVELSVGVSQAAQSATKATTDPTAIPSSQDRKISGSLGNELEQLAAVADPGKFNSIVNAIKQAKRGQ
jgi:hypothetical protein